MIEVWEYIYPLDKSVWLFEMIEGSTKLDFRGTILYGPENYKVWGITGLFTRNHSRKLETHEIIKYKIMGYLK